jgi:hypothetical protein
MKHSTRPARARRRTELGRLSRLIAESNPDSGEVLDVLNSISVTAEELWRVGHDLESRRDAYRHREGFSASDVFAVVSERFRNIEPEKGSAIFFRFEALTCFLAKDPSLAWDDALVAAAAVEPVVQIGDELTFQRESFLRRVLEFHVPRSAD